MLPPCLNISSYAEWERSGIALLPIPQTFGYGWDVYFTPFGLSTCEPYPLDPPILWMGGYKGTKNRLTPACLLTYSYHGWAGGSL